MAMSLKQQANSKGGSGLVQATAFYRGSRVDGHNWKVVAKVNGRQVYSEDQYETGFVGAGIAAQAFADYVFTMLYDEGALEPTDREVEAQLAFEEELALDRESWTEEDWKAQREFDKLVALMGSPL